MKKNLVSLLLVGALVAPGALQTIEATGTGTGASYSLIGEVQNDDGTITKTLLTNYGSTITQTVDSDGNVISQVESDPVVPPTSFDDERVYVEQVKYTEPVNFDTIEQETDQLPEGKVIVQTEGVAGVRTFYIDMGYWKSGEIVYDEARNPLVREYNEITQAPVDELILTGTGIMGEEKDTTRIEIPFETKVIYNDELEIGEETVKTEGVKGWVEYTVVYETKDGVRGDVLEEKHETDRKEPVNKVIEKGTKVVEGEVISREDLLEREGEDNLPKFVFATEEEAQAAIEALDEEEQDGLEVRETADKEGFYVVHVISAMPIEPIEPIKPIAYSREDLLGRDNDLITFETEEDAQAAIDALDEEEKEGLEVKETDDGLFYVAHVISATPIEPIKPIEKDNFHVNVVKNDFPQYDKEDYSYEVETLDDFVFITITDANGEFVAEIEYNIADQTTRIVSVALIPLEPAKPIEKDEETTEEETTEEEVVDVVIANGQPVRVVRTDSRSELPETGELGGTTAMMAAALSALGGLGLLFKKRK